MRVQMQTMSKMMKLGGQGERVWRGYSRKCRPRALSCPADWNKMIPAADRAPL